MVVSDIVSFSPLFGEDSHFDLIFVKWVETTNQFWLNHQIALIPSPNLFNESTPRPDWWRWFLRMSKLSSSSLATPLQAPDEGYGLKRLRWNRLNMKKIRRHTHPRNLTNISNTCHFWRESTFSKLLFWVINYPCYIHVLVYRGVWLFTSNGVTSPPSRGLGRCGTPRTRLRMQRMARARGRGLPSGGNRVLKARWKHGANVRKLEYIEERGKWFHKILAVSTYFLDFLIQQRCFNIFFFGFSDFQQHECESQMKSVAKKLPSFFSKHMFQAKP